MGVSVRLSRSTRIYLPFWAALPVWLLGAAVFVVVAAALLIARFAVWAVRSIHSRLA
jgi:hypothetical protein